MAETVEFDTKQEPASPNGHDDAWQTFDTDDALLAHITSKEPAEELIEVPEWGVKVLCKALDAEGRIMVDTQAYNTETKRTNYSKVPHVIVMYGCYNPKTGNRVFSEGHENVLKEPRHGGAVYRLAATILRLSGMVSNDVENAKKN
jgi:hypothetical protein